MESRGEAANGPSASRPAIARRSCDHCRARKIGCDRGSPCSNCISARLHCTHSAIATKTTISKQRVMITTQYEQKIDNIARGVDGIKHLLERLDVTPHAKQQNHGSSYSVASPTEEKGDFPAVAEPTWDYSGHIIDFVKGVVNDRGIDAVVEQKTLIPALKKLLHTVEDNKPGPHLSIPSINVAQYPDHSTMPPLDVAVSLLRWAKANDAHPGMVWISRVLPLDMFSDIYRKVYFAIDNYTEIDYILANGYLSYISREHVSVSGLPEYQKYYLLCRENLHNACARLPLLLPPSMEVIAALTLGAFNAVEDFKVSLAWAFISNASNLCQTLGYHLDRSTPDMDKASRQAETRLFWTVYRMEKGLSLRLGRSSNIRDTDITLPYDREGERHSRLGRIQGKVWDQLYSPTSLAQVDVQVRGQLAQSLANELRELISETRSHAPDLSQQTGEYDQDTVQDVYVQAELVCHSSLLALILRATPPELGSLCSASDECVAVARRVLDLHEQCVRSMRAHKNNPFTRNKYLSWSVVHHPFVPFSILFSRAVQLLDIDDMERLERFAASLQPEQTSAKPAANIQRLYELLCQAARLYIDTKTSSHLTAEQILPYDALNPTEIITLTNFDMGARTLVNEPLEPGNLEPGNQPYSLSDWYSGNQQLMSLLDDDITF